MPLESVYLNGGFIGATRSYFSEITTTATPSFVVGTNYDQSLDTEFSYPLGIQEGDFIIIAQSNDSGDVSTPPSDDSSTTYTALVQYTGSNPDYLISYKFADGTESGDDLIINRSNSRGAAVIQVFRGIDETTPFDVTYTTASSGGVNGDPDAPSITTVTDNSMIVSIGFLDDDSGVTVTAPSGYSNLNYGESSAGGGEDSVTMMASKLLATAGSENPPGFDTTGNDAWQAVTVALRRKTTTTQEYESGIFNLQAVVEALGSIPIPILPIFPWGGESINLGSTTRSYTSGFPLDISTDWSGSSDFTAAIDFPNGISSGDTGVILDLGGSSTGTIIVMESGTIYLGSDGHSENATFSASFTPYVGQQGTLYFTVNYGVTDGEQLYWWDGLTMTELITTTMSGDGAGGNNTGVGRQADQGWNIGTPNDSGTFTGTIDGYREWDGTSFDFSTV